VILTFSEKNKEKYNEMGIPKEGYFYDYNSD
jgi:hypothetical protein